MPRGTQRKSERVAVNAPQLRDPQIQEQTRYIDRGRNANALGTANALREAFQVGAAVTGQVIDKKNSKGALQAQSDRSMGIARDIENKNEGYNKAWSELEAEHDWRQAKDEFNETLRGADFENMEEAEVQSLFNTFMEARFKGADQDLWYGNYVAPKMVEFELETIATHRGLVLSNIQAEQGSLAYSNLLGRFTETGEFDYEYLASETNRIYDGADKSVKYMEMLFDFAIENGRPDLIDGMPDKFPTGQVTPKNRPELQDEIRAARTQAQNVATAKDTAATKANEAERDAVLQSAGMAAVVAMATGNPQAEALVLQYSQLPGAEYKDVSALRKSLSTIRDDVEEHEADPAGLAVLTTAVYLGEKSERDILQAFSDGELGGGLTAVKTLATLMTKVQSVRSQNSSAGTNPMVKTHLDNIKAHYNPQLAGPLGKIDKRRAAIVEAALFDYRTAVFDNNEDPNQAHERIRAQYDATLSRLDEGQIKFGDPNAGTPKEVASRWLNGEMGDYDMKATGFTMDQIESMDLDPADESRLLDLLY